MNQGTTTLSSLHQALDARDVQTVHTLLAAGADPNARHPSGIPLLHKAVVSYQEDDTSVALLQLLLEHGADPNDATHSDPPLFLWAYVGLERSVRVLLDHGARIDQRSRMDQHNVLQCACAGGILWLVERCLAERQDPNHLSSQGHSALQYVMRAEKPTSRLHWRAMAEMLVAAGANVHHMGRLEWGSVLHWAVRQGVSDAVRWALEKGIAVDIRSAQLQTTPLHQAARRGDPEIISILLDAGADLHATDATGWTPLHHAALSSRPEAITLLRNKGAPTEVRSTATHQIGSTRYAARKTPREIAVRTKNPAVMDAFV